MMRTLTPIETLLSRAKLPVLPAVATRLMQLISQEDVLFDDISRLLVTDAALSAEVLRAANSPLFGSRNEVKSIRQALTTLGLDRVSLLVVTTALWRSIPGSFNRQVVRSWWRHNLATAFFAKHLGSQQSEDNDYYYMSGLLHSAGQLALLGAFPTDYWELLTRAAAGSLDVSECEAQMFGATHCEVGAALLKTWLVPDQIAEGAQYHHTPELAEHEATRAVHIACCAANQLGYSVLGSGRKPLESIPEAAREVVLNDVLSVEIEEKVNALESSLL